MGSAMIHVTKGCLRDLGWPRVLDAVADRCANDLARAALAEQPLLSDVAAVAARLDLVREVSRLGERDVALPVAPLHDITEVVQRCRRGGMASAEGLVQIGQTCATIGRLRRHADHHGSDAPLLMERAAALPDLAALGSELLGTFDEAGRIRDDASPELREARRRLASLHQAIKARLDRYLQRPEVQELIQDDYYTQRDERFVIPVMSSFQGRISGIIHGTSHTGQTVYLEPEEFISANNEIKLAESAVEVETRRVLAERSAWVSQEATELLRGLDLGIELDTMQARARFGAAWDCAIPEVDGAGRLELLDARNPLLLLKGSAVIANDVLIGAEHSFVVITGPNTGGKTVTLSTAGLLTLMTCAGVPIPAADGSRVVVPRALHALVGDAQDIQRDLSTFSGHLLALRGVIDDAGPGALVLLDEIAVGTEPERGAALAIAVLESLADRGARGLVTTHYQRLKTLPYGDARFANANVGIDPATFQPTYRLEMGQPGSSNPLVIAERLGFFPDILARARALTAGDSGLAEAIAGLEAAGAAADRAREAAEAAQRAAEAEAARLEVQRARIEAEVREQVQRLAREAFEETAELLERVRARVRELQEARDSREVQEVRREVVALRERIEEVGEEAESPPAVASGEPGDGGDLDALPPVGSTVWVRPLQRLGEVVELRGEHAVVAVGALRVTVERSRLARALGGPQAAPRPAPAAGRPRGGWSGPS